MRVDQEFDALILRVLGAGGLDKPMKETLNVAGEGVVGVVTDPADFGSNAHYMVVPEAELEEIADMASDALRRSYEIFKESEPE